MNRECMEVDIVIVGAGPSGLATACRLAQISKERGMDLSIVVVEKGAEVGAHILSGAVFEARALFELFPDWRERKAPLNVPVKSDEIYYLKDQHKSWRISPFFVPSTMHNEGNYIISLGNLVRWLGDQAELLGVDIYPGFAASEVLFSEEDGAVKGIATGDCGISRDLVKKSNFEPGMELHAKYTVFSEGCRGHLGKQLIERFDLDKGKDPQHYGLGIKELWEIDPSTHREGLVLHTAGWPLTESKSLGGGFMYHLDNNQVALGFITELGYSNPYVAPFEEMQRWKHSDVISRYLQGGKRISYGARAIATGGLQSLVKMHFPGGLITGCNAGTLNFAKIKGSHTAMKSGMIAAETIASAIADSRQGDDLEVYATNIEQSWLHEELFTQRNFGAYLHKFGDLIGSGMAFVDINLFKGQLPWTLRNKTPDHATLKPLAESRRIDYPAPDGDISFNKLDSVYLSNTNHEEDQPVHLMLADADIPIKKNLPIWDEPAQRYCPAGVYEVINDPESGEPRFHINPQNCVHCKTCDIKDPSQNIRWVTPEGGGGPTYPNM